VSFRTGIYFGVVFGIILALFFLRLWQPAQQVQKHSDQLLHAISHKNWTKFASLVADNYHDQWGNDRTAVLERSRELFGYLRGIRISAVAPDVRIESGTGHWRARIFIDGEDNEVMEALKTRINPLQAPFELEWQHQSGKPWDWQLVAVRNPELVLPQE